MHIWDRLLPQPEILFNMLWPTNIAPQISAYACMYKQHDYDKMPLGSIGCVVLLHDKSDFRKTWDDHAVNGFYISTSQEHYRCSKFGLKTWSIRISGTIFFKYKYITMPKVTKADAIVVAANVATLNNSKYIRNRQSKINLLSKYLSYHSNKNKKQVCSSQQWNKSEQAGPTEDGWCTKSTHKGNQTRKKEEHRRVNQTIEQEQANHTLEETTSPH